MFRPIRGPFQIFTVLFGLQANLVERCVSVRDNSVEYWLALVNNMSDITSHSQTELKL